ncbi:hypothetical protein FDP41_011046 [Naegleria fowleri]|uniref:beta-N-acetylhexosaminidase n=1 Tax=Naegleria fowleri TaxID=5763 RepID=A0A6A5CBX0_NAEFO|nr:uncharacterized protein FDP41_011046 [Naegleria fowleri]KAF0983068.1 hypothetical protein FDP41_011046 [Naegleria fowleri]
MNDIPILELEQQTEVDDYSKKSLLQGYELVMDLNIQDQAWRIEISSFPKLTEIGAWRKLRKDEQDLVVGNDKLYGGFYSTSDISFLVEYCHSKGILIVPEIELPGHSSAAVIAYPEWLTCEDSESGVKIFTPEMTPPNEWGIFNDVYCAGKESTFQFLETVLDQVIQLFPHSPIIHIGGDEVPESASWMHCSKCQQLAKRNEEYSCKIEEISLFKQQQLYSYFIHRIYTFLQSKGKCMVGWDEVFMSNSTGRKDNMSSKDNLIIQSWRGTEGAQRAIQNQIHTILSPTSHCYFDYGIEIIPLKKVLSFNPFKLCELDMKHVDETTAAFILGGECNCWTERMQTKEKLQQMIFPRVLAMSEALWCEASWMKQEDISKDGHYYVFLDRCQRHYGTILKHLRIGKECYPLECFVDEKNQDVIHLVKVDDQDEKQEIYFFIPGITNEYVKYENISPQSILHSHANRGEVQLYTQVIRNSLIYGMKQVFHLVFHNALFCQVRAIIELNDNGSRCDYDSYVLETTNKNRYSGDTMLGLRTLVNGVRGDPLCFHSKEWIGFEGTPRVEIICSKWRTELSSLSRLSIGCLHKPRSWIFMPKKISFYYESTYDQETTNQDSEKWIFLGEISCWDPSFIQEHLQVTPEMLRDEEQTFRFDFVLSNIHPTSCSECLTRRSGGNNIHSIKVVVESYHHATTPTWHHSQGGKPSWFFLDQIIVNS